MPQIVKLLIFCSVLCCNYCKQKFKTLQKGKECLNANVKSVKFSQASQIDKTGCGPLQRDWSLAYLILWNSKPQKYDNLLKVK